MLGPRERLIALNIQINVGGDGGCDLMDAFGSRPMRGRRHLDIESVLLAELSYLLRIGGNEHFLKRGRKLDGLINPRQQRHSTDFA